MILCAIRGYDVGRDTPNYVEAAMNTYSYNSTWGPIYYILIKFSQFFSNPATIFLCLMAALTYIPLIVVVRSKSVLPALSVLMYIIPTAAFFYESFNLARQSIAIVYILLAAIFLKDKKIKLSIVMTLIAFFFHPYTIFFSIFYLISKIKFTKSLVNTLVYGSMIIGLLGTITVIQDTLSLMSFLFEDTSSAMLTKFSKYGNDSYNIISNYSVIGQLSHILPLSAMCLLGINKKTEDDVLFKVMVCGCVVTNLFVSVIFCERIASTFSIAQFLAVPIIFSTSTKIKRQSMIVLLIFTAFLYVYNLYQQSLNPYVWTPYHTFFN
jgi:hypothetical protein